MSPFLRIGLSNYDSGPYLPSQGDVIDPYCAVMVKEAVESGKDVQPYLWACIQVASPVSCVFMFQCFQGNRFGSVLAKLCITCCFPYITYILNVIIHVHIFYM